MNIVLVSDNKVMEVISVKTIEVNKNNIKYENEEGPAELNGVLADFYIVDNDAYEINQELSAEELNDLQTVDKKEEFKHIDLEAENAELKTRLESAEMAIIGLMDFVTK